MGDPAAFEELYEGLAPLLIAFFRRGAADGAVAEDLTQQTFLQIHLARERYVTGLDVVPWAFAIARRLRIDAFRKSRRVVVGDVANDAPSEQPSPHEELEGRRLAATLHRALGALPEPQRAAYELVVGDGLTMAQAAGALCTTVMAIKLRLHRARQTLREGADASCEVNRVPP